MASGTIGASSNTSTIIGSLVWSSVSNTAGNYSDVTATLRMWRTNDYTTWGTGTWTISINGVTSSVTASKTISLNSNTLIHTFTTRVYHNSDGTKSININATGGIPGTSYTSTTASGTAVLDTIPRATTPSIPASTSIGSVMTITHTGASTAFAHKLYYSFATANKAWIANIGANDTSTSWTPDYTTFGNLIKTTTSGTLTITCETYTDANYTTLIGTKTCTSTLSLPSSVIPTMGGITAVEQNANVSTIVGKFVKGLSNIKFTINGATSYYGATITSYKINFNNVNYTSSSYTTGVLGISGSYTATATVTDSRGRVSNNYTVPVDILPYSPPYVTGFTVVRCTPAGVEDDKGTSVKIVRSATATSLKNGTTEKNTISCTVQYKERSSTTWITAGGTTTVSASSSVGTAITNTPITLTTAGTFLVEKAYDFRFNVVDKFNTTITTATVSTGSTIMSWSETGVGIGKIWSDGALDVQGSVNITDTVNTTLKIKNTTDTQNAEGRIVFEDATGTQAVQLRYNHWDATRSPYGLHIETGEGNVGAGAYLEVEGDLISESSIIGNRVKGLVNTEQMYVGTGNCRVDTSSGSMRLYTSAIGSADYGVKIPSGGGLEMWVNSSSPFNVTSAGNVTSTGWMVADDFWTPSGTYNRNTTGYSKLPNGVIMQWGQTTVNFATAVLQQTLTVTLPIGFPNSRITVVGSVNSSSMGAYSDFNVSLQSVNATQIFLDVKRVVGAGAIGNVYVNWIALGY